MSKLGEQITVVILAIISVSVLAIVLSKNSNTVNVANAASNGFAAALRTALSPITGGGNLNSFGGIQ